jgi:hypothetical protein
MQVALTRLRERYQSVRTQVWNHPFQKTRGRHMISVEENEELAFTPIQSCLQRACLEPIAFLPTHYRNEFQMLFLV